MQDWTKDFFSAGALEAWRRSCSPESTLAEVEFILEALALGEAPQRGRLLDVPCGDARHAVELAKHGYLVTAVDGAPDNQRAANARAAEAKVTIDFVLGDMRALPQRDAFSGALCWGNSFGYFPHAETEQFVASVGASLAPGARFVIDTATCAECLLVELQRRSWQRIDDEMVLLLKCEYNTRESRLDTTYTSILRDRVVDRRTAHHYVFTSAQLLSMLKRAGFGDIELYGDLDSSSFELGAERLIVVAERE